MEDLPTVSDEILILSNHATGRAVEEEQMRLFYFDIPAD